MIDNFKFFEQYIPSDPNKYVIIQVIKRNKDLGVQGHNKSYGFYMVNMTNYEKYKEDIIMLCETFNARAYIDIQVRTYMNYYLELNKMLAEAMYNGSTSSHFHESAAIKARRENKLFLFDVDDPCIIDKVRAFIPEDIKPIQVKTVNGYHLLCPHFDLREFRASEYAEAVEIKTNNPTLLYFPLSLTITKSK